MSTGLSTFTINRAPVLTLWGTIVAERLGFDHDEALTLGRAVAGLNAYAKGKRLGLFKPSHDDLRKKRSEGVAGTFDVELLHRAVPVVMTPGGIRALPKGKPTAPESVETYLASKFGEHLVPTEQAMARLSKSYAPAELADVAFRLYESFRPDVPAGVEGWGASGVLDLAKIRSAAG
ncbi:MAG: hypothetical protein U1F47_08870 [Hyphomicrobiales bacterium]